MCDIDECIWRLLWLTKCTFNKFESFCLGSLRQQHKRPDGPAASIINQHKQSAAETRVSRLPSSDGVTELTV